AAIDMLREPAQYDDALDEQFSCAVFGSRFDDWHVVKSDLARSAKNDPAVWELLRNIPGHGRGVFRHGALHRNPPRGRYLVDAACHAQDLYARYKIEQIGRQGHADELVDYDIKRAKLVQCEGRLYPEDSRLRLAPIV